MGFIMEFAENLVLRLMEDPKERDRKFREHVYSMKDRCAKTKEMWSYPLRPYGFWTFERHNAQLRWDPQISQVPGRRDPYDDLLQDSKLFTHRQLTLQGLEYVASTKVLEVMQANNCQMKSFFVFYLVTSATVTMEENQKPLADGLELDLQMGSGH
ncbi:hypothetical protein Goari_024176 [Gossypium aridum]|uniref:Uncharacterized protein n=1 Tax=Gossypium aridum TaxID=34290 RepID=A0A7J8X597_GOSAI|nr:hypothetical protein [Gossypium aridum]